MRLLSISLLFGFSFAANFVYAQSDSQIKADAKIEASSEISAGEEDQLTVPENVANEQPVDSAPIAKSEKQEKPELSSKTLPPREVFKPSEEISEDRPVPFPVDI